MWKGGNMQWPRMDIELPRYDFTCTYATRDGLLSIG